jgi:hypothetical protein
MDATWRGHGDHVRVDRVRVDRGALFPCAGVARVVVLRADRLRAGFDACTAQACRNRPRSAVRVMRSTARVRPGNRRSAVR